MKSKVAQLLERYGYQQEHEPSEYNVRYSTSDRYELPVSVINGIWEWSALRSVSSDLLKHSLACSVDSDSSRCPTTR